MNTLDFVCQTVHVLMTQVLQHGSSDGEYLQECVAVLQENVAERCIRPRVWPMDGCQ